MRFKSKVYIHKIIRLYGTGIGRAACKSLFNKIGIWTFSCQRIFSCAKCHFSIQNRLKFEERNLREIHSVLDNVENISMSLWNWLDFSFFHQKKKRNGMPAEYLKKRFRYNLNLLNAKCGTDQFVLEMVGIVLSRAWEKRARLAHCVPNKMTNKSKQYQCWHGMHVECALDIHRINCCCPFSSCARYFCLSLFLAQSGSCPGPKRTKPNHNSPSISLKHNIICARLYQILQLVMCTAPSWKLFCLIIRPNGMEIKKGLHFGICASKNSRHIFFQ